MLKLYVDNFRGFSKTVVPLLDVNFLVGENSTGKTSVISLLNLISSNDFWQTLDFNTQEYEFGGFKDIVSLSSEENIFSFGLCEESRDLIQNPSCYMVSFKEKDSIPVLSRFSLIADGNILAIKVDDQGYSFFNRPINLNVLNDTRTIIKSLNMPFTEESSAFKPFHKQASRRIGLWTLFFWLEPKVAFPSSKMIDRFFGIGSTLSNIASFGPIRTKPKRTYDGYGRLFSPEGEHTPYVLRQVLSDKAKVINIEKRLKKIGESSGLFKTLRVKRYGKDASSPFELRVVLSKDAIRLNSVGYGVSQALPFIVEMLFRRKGTWFLIQQPEIHLHPKAQAAIGDLIFEMAELKDKKFIIETHSDFAIDRFRMNYHRIPEHKTDAQVLFFERTKAGNLVNSIPILKNGSYAENQPSSFRDFFIKEQLDLINI